MNAYEQLANELTPWVPTLAKAADTILDQEVSKYPIFVTYKGEIAIGLPLLERPANEWSFNASSLEEFATKGLITADRIENFREVYKDPTAFVCLFLITEAGANFAFLPRK
ncbi:MAG: hypothetical protein AAFW73_03215 [Bacteroidota bacterium]